MIEKLGHNGWPLAGDGLLGLEENFPADDRLVDRLDIFRKPLAFDKAGIERVCQKPVNETLGGLLVS